MIYTPVGRAGRSSDGSWEQRLDRWRAGEIELTEDECERFMAERADIALITRYFGGELGPAECAEVEARARTDAEFRLDLHIVNAMNGRIRAGLHDATLFGLHQTTRARRRGNRLLAASIVVVGSMLALGVGFRLRQAGMWLDQRIAERAITADLKTPRTVDAFWRDKTIGFELADIAVRAGSRVTFPDDFRKAGGSGVIALDGEAAIHSWASGIIVRTSSAVVHGMAGRYAVRSILHSGVTLVTVDSGLVWIEALGTETRAGSGHRILASMHAGDRATVTRGRVVSFAANDAGFPVSAFDAPAWSNARNTSEPQQRSRRSFAVVDAKVKLDHGVR